MAHHCLLFPSFQWNSWLSETVSNCLLSHLTLSFFKHYHGFENWCSGQLFILVYGSDDLTNIQGSVFSLQWWPEVEKKEKTYKPLHLELLDVFLKHCQGKNEFKQITSMIILIFFILYWQYCKRTNDYKGFKFNCFFKT